MVLEFNKVSYSLHILEITDLMSFAHVVSPNLIGDRNILWYYGHLYPVDFSVIVFKPMILIYNHLGLLLLLTLLAWESFRVYHQATKRCKKW